MGSNTSVVNCELGAPFRSLSLSISNSPWLTNADFETICRVLEPLTFMP